MGAKDAQTLKAIREAEAFDGVSIIIAYSHCIEHGYDMGDAATHQKAAIETGYWPLYRFNPRNAQGKRFKLDSKPPSRPLEDFMYLEGRFNRVAKQDPERGKLLLDLATQDLEKKWNQLEAAKSL